MGHIEQPTKIMNIVPEQGITSQLGAHRVLIVGRMLTGTAAADELYIDVPSSASEINALFGKTSHIAGLLRDFRAINKVSRLDAYPFANGGVQAEATLAFSGSTSTADATITVTIGSAHKYSVTVDIPSGSTPLDAAAAVSDAFQPLIADAPFAVGNTVNEVDITATNGGAIPLEWDLQYSGTVPDQTISWILWDLGSGDPVNPDSTVVAAIDGIRYHTIVWPSRYSVANLVAEFDNNRFNASAGVMDGVIVQANVNTLANAKAYADDFNSQSMSIIWNKVINTTTHKGGAVVEMPDIISAKVAALRALRLTDGANLTPYLTTVASRDQFGGVGIASLPYFNTIIPGIAPASPAEFPGFEDVEEATDNALSTIGPNSAFNTTIFGEMVTTYLTDGQGAPDVSYKFLNTVDTISAIRETFVLNLGRRYGQSRLTNGDLEPGRDLANESSIRAFCNEVYDDLAELVLVQSGSAAKRDFNENLIITLDIAAGTATIDMKPLLVSQLRAIIGTIAVNFGG